MKKLHCPCTNYWGRKRFFIHNIREHLIRNGKDPDSRTWRGPGARDSLDEEWEDQFWGPVRHADAPLQVDATIHTCGMLDQAFNRAEDDSPLEERIQEEVTAAFDIADSIHEEFMEGGIGDEAEEEEPCDDQHPLPVEAARDDVVPHFDATVMDESLQSLYNGARCSQLASTVLLMNLCTVHGINNQCANELFTLSHSHILLENNTLPRTHYAAKTLTAKLGLTYNLIHACERGCVLFQGPHEDDVCCPKCGGRRYRDKDRRCFLVKVLHHFPIIPRLQQMFRNPSISKLMVWHAANHSNQPGGDGLV